MASAGETGTPIVAIDGPRATVRLNRPRHHNRLEPADLKAIVAIIDDIDANTDLRVLVLTGTGKSFSSGYHIGDLQQRQASQGEVGDGPNAFEAMVDRLEACAVPTIAALQGSVYGGATDLALACDFRIGAEGIVFRMPAARLGIHYYPNGLRRYVERLGLAAAKKLFLTAATIEAEEMRAIGYLDRVVAPRALDATVDDLAAEIAANAPLSVRGMKRSLNMIARGAVDEAAILEAARACRRSEDIKEGLAAWAERRPPRFKGR